MEQLSHYDVKTDLYLVWVHLFRAAKKEAKVIQLALDYHLEKIFVQAMQEFLENTTENQKVSAATFIPFGVLPSYRFCSNGSRMA